MIVDYLVIIGIMIQMVKVRLWKLTKRVKVDIITICDNKTRMTTG